MTLRNYQAPPALTCNSNVAVISTSSVLDKKRFKKGKEILEDKFGFKPIQGPHLFSQHHNFAGTDEERLADFQDMLDNPDINGIIAGRGGYGASRIIEKVNWEGFKKSPKWIVGFSDLTVVHQKIQSLGYQSIHGPMMVTLANDKTSRKSLKKALYGEQLSYLEKGHSMNRIGESSGNILGGNLCLLSHGIGSSSDLNFDGNILFLEDIGEYLYNIDRMMIQLKRAGKLSNLAGLIVGQLSGCKENSRKFGKNAYQIIEEHTSEFDYPVCYDFPIGHQKKNRAIRCGEKMQLQINKDNVNLNSIK